MKKSKKFLLVLVFFSLVFLHPCYVCSESVYTITETELKQSDYKEPIRNIEDRSCITSRKRGAENLYIICIELNAIYFIFVRYNRTS